MHARFAISVVMAGFFVLLAGCSTPSAPLQRDKLYPADWPDLVPLGPEGAEINGTYANAGTATAGKGGLEPITLLSIIPKPANANQVPLATTFPQGKVVTLQAVARKNQSAWKDPPGNSTLRVTVDSDPATQAKVDGFCTLSGVQYALHNSFIALPIGFGGDSAGVFLNKGTDGSLIAKIEYSGAGIILLVPVWSFSHVWARFPLAQDAADKDSPAKPEKNSGSKPAPK